MAYIGNSPENIQRGRRSVYEFKATAGQTAFSGADLNNQTLDLLEENEMGVYLNGIRLADSDDYSISGDTLTLLSAASLNDQLTVETQAEVANISSYTRTEADARYINYDGDIVAGDLQISGEVDAGSLIVDTDVLVVDATNNRVGIGTNSPSATVDVVSSGTNSQSLAEFSSASGLRAKIASDAGDDGYLYLYDTNDANTVSFRTDGNHSFISGGGNFGIGTASPGFRFHAYHPTTNVVGKLESGDDEVWLALTDVGTDNYGTLIGRKSSTNTLFKIADENVIERFTVLENGNVGIGTDSPSNLLEIEKDVTTQHSTSANLSNTANNAINFVRLTNSNTSITTPEVNLLFSAGGSGSGQHSIGVTRTGSNTGDMIFRRRTASATSAESMRIFDNGNVSILNSNGLSSLNTINNALTIGDVTAGNLAFDLNEIQARTNGAANNLLLQKLGGNVAIGTTSPTHKLQILDNTDASARCGIKVSKTISNLNGADFSKGIFSEVINNDNTALTGDREFVGLHSQVTNNGTGGNTSNETRPYGVYSLVTDNGDADTIYGGFFRSLSNSSAGTTTNMYGIEAIAEADNSGSSVISNAYGVRGQTFIDNAGSSVNTAYGLYGRVYQYADGGDVASTASAVYGEIEMNNSSSGNIAGNTFAFQAQIDNNTTRNNVFGGSVFMYYGNYAGTQSGNIYGVYIADSFASNYFAGSVSKGSGSFRIPHPKPELTDTKDLVHSFVEGPQADNLYRGRVTLVDGSATVNIDTVSTMTEGTFVLLNRDVQCFTTNETGWTNIRGSVSGNILTIEAQDNTCTDTISWMVIGERQDQHMYDTNWTDSDGKVIVEPDKMVHPTPPEDE